MRRGETAEDKERKGIKKTFLQGLDLWANVIEIGNFLKSLIHPIVAKAVITTAVVGGTVLAGKTVIDETSQISERLTNIETAVLEPTLVKKVAGESDEVIIPETPTIASTPTPTSTPKTSIISVQPGWGHFGRIFYGPPETNPDSELDPTTIPFYITITNTGEKADKLIGGTSNLCSSIHIQDMNIPAPPGSGDNLSSIIIPAGNTFEMEFGGIRMVCNGAHNIEVGGQLPVTLIFDSFGEVSTSAKIQQTPD